VTGSARPGRVTAILGPSGSGKTTLLTALANQVPQSPSVSLTGRVYVNGHLNHDQGGHTQAFVRQQDEFYSQLTVRETLLMAARLRLPDSMSLQVCVMETHCHPTADENPMSCLHNLP
jgi:ABC-type multidrug transport system ATPase subunit